MHLPKSLFFLNSKGKENMVGNYRNLVGFSFPHRSKNMVKKIYYFVNLYKEKLPLKSIFADT